MELSEKSIKELNRLKGLYPSRRSAVLMALHVVYDQFGFVGSEALGAAAEILEIPVMELQEAASFYTMFPRRKAGKYHIQVCRTLSCELRGSEELMRFLMEKLKVEMGGVTADGVFSLTEVECLGSCGTGPMMQINDKYYENLNRAKTEKILKELRERAKIG